jgi:hypothetical protein
VEAAVVVLAATVFLLALVVLAEAVMARNEQPAFRSLARQTRAVAEVEAICFLVTAMVPLVVQV